MTESVASIPGTITRESAFGPARTPMHSGIDVGRFVAMHAMGAIFPMTAGVLLFGWRAVGAVALVVFSAGATTLIWRRVGSRGVQLRLDHCTWLSTLLALTLPANLFGAVESGHQLWPILVAGGMLLVIFTWLLGGVGAGRVHPVLVTNLLLFVCFNELLVPHFVLLRRHLIKGELFNAVMIDQTITRPWIRTPDIGPYEAMETEPASRTLLAFTSGATSPSRAWLSLDALLRDRMPPLEDLIIGGHPAPLGLGSAIAVIIGGLFLLYRGLIDYRVPSIIILSAAVAMLILPVPVVILENKTDWSWIVMRAKGVGAPVALTLVNYELMAGPLLFMAFFLATSSAVRPVVPMARIFYSLVTGVLSAVLQLYVSVAVGPYLALLAASAVTPLFDKIFRPRTLV